MGNITKEGDPFLIRGHHVAKGPLGFSDRIFFDSTIPTDAEIESVVAENVVRLKRNLTSEFSWKAQYARDVLGGTPSVYQNRYHDLIKRFRLLPGEHPVKLVTTLDELCKTCIVGQHCLAIAASEEDKWGIGLFERTRDWLGLRSQSDNNSTSARSKLKTIETTKSEYIQVISALGQYFEHIVKSFYPV